MNAIPAAATDVRTLYLLDDNAEFCSTAKWWLQGAGYDVLDFQDAWEALEALKLLTPAEITQACLLLDVRMPELSGLQVHDILIDHGITGSGARPALPIIYMTGHGDVPLAVQAMEKGAVTFLEKPFQDSALELALNRAFAQQGVTPAVPEAVAAPASPQPVCALFQQRYELLSPREREILDGVVAGNTNKVIARELGISVKTVEMHRSHMMEKMQAESAVHLTRMFVAQRVL